MATKERKRGRARDDRPGAGPREKPDPVHYGNRELELLEFDRRVLEQAKDPRVPLLERLRFLAISSTNLDEFFEIRVAGLKEQVAHGVSQGAADGLSPAECLQRIHLAAHDFVREQYRVLDEDLLPALEAQGIRILKRAAWRQDQQRWIRRYFRSEVLPILTPMGLDLAHPFPMVLNKGLSFIVSIEGSDAFGRSSGTAVLQVPRSLPRVIALPRDISEGPYDFVLLSSVIHAHADELFPGMVTTGCYQFRVTRNSDLWVDEEEADDLLKALEGELPGRNYGEAVRLEVAENITPEMSRYLLGRTRLSEEDLYRVQGPVNLHRLAALCELVDRPDLGYKPHVPRVPERLAAGSDLFESLRKNDVLLHHPYDSFGPVLELVRMAAADPDVVAIRQTLYRTDPGSPLVSALIDAARAGKEVTAVVELRARFDEEANIGLVKRLQEVGANVAYGIVGYKCHAKMLLVLRREGKKIVRYAHLGTGNYHAKTARVYTDFGLMTADADVGEDVHKLFQQLTGLGRVPELAKLLQAPFTLQSGLLALVAAEAEAARAGKPARIVAKMNALSDPAMIQALYDASRAGVEIDLVVRGVCCLRPGVPGLSETIRVRSVIGRFLEHSRVFCFHAGGEERVYCSSADWMPRNLYHRVEVCFPIEDPELRRRVVREALEVNLQDDPDTWHLGSDGKWARRDGTARHPQEVLLEQAGK